MSLSVVNILFGPVILPLNIEVRAGYSLCGKSGMPQMWAGLASKVSFVIFRKLQVVAKKTPPSHFVLNGALHSTC